MKGTTIIVYSFVNGKKYEMQCSAIPLRYDLFDHELRKLGKDLFLRIKYYGGKNEQKNQD